MFIGGGVGSIGRIGGGGRRGGGGAPAPSAEPAITSIPADGTFATLAAAPSGPEPNIPIVLRRTGYEMGAGDAAPVLRQWDETVWLTHRRITPGQSETAGGYVGNDVMWSRVVMQGDTFPNQAGTTNNSTRVPPTVTVRWLDCLNFKVIGNSAHTFRLNVQSPYTRNANPVAAVAVVLNDGVNPAVRAYARVQSQWTGRGVSGYVAHAYEVTFTEAQMTALATGRVTADWEVYGHYGQLLTSAGDARNATRWFHGRLWLRKHAAMAATPLHVFVRPGVPASTPQASTDPAVARANPYGTWQAARDAAMVANNSTFSLGTNCMDGVIVRYMDTGTGGNVIALPTISGSSVCLIAGFIVEPDPLGTWTGGSILEAFNSQIGGSTNESGRIGYEIRNWSQYRRPSAQANWFTNPAGVLTTMYLTGPAGGGVLDFNGTGMSAIGSNAYAILTGLTAANMPNAQYLAEAANTGVAGTHDCVFPDLLDRILPGFSAICTRGRNGRVAGVATDRGIHMDAVVVEGSPTSTQPIITASPTTNNPILARNTILVPLNSSEQFRLRLSGDNDTYSLSNVAFHHCTIPGLSGAVRANAGYTEGADPLAAARAHLYFVFSNCVLPPIACKGDFFGNAAIPDANREPGWREFGYGVGSGGNFYSQHYAILPLGDESEAQRFPGRVCAGAISAGPSRLSGPFVNPGFVDPRVPTVTGGANGTAGGDYRCTFQHAESYPPDVQWDILGNAVAASNRRPGAHSGYVP